MAYFLATHPNLLEKLRLALPKNPKVTITRTSYTGIVKKVTSETLKLKGIAKIPAGLVFTFDNGERHTLEDFERVSIIQKPDPKNSWDKKPPYHSRIAFNDEKGVDIVMILK